MPSRSPFASNNMTPNNFKWFCFGIACYAFCVALFKHDADFALAAFMAGMITVICLLGHEW